jgi:hypothetical protein
MRKNRNISIWPSPRICGCPRRDLRQSATPHYHIKRHRHQLGPVQHRRRPTQAPARSLPASPATHAGTRSAPSCIAGNRRRHQLGSVLHLDTTSDLQYWRFDRVIRIKDLIAVVLGILVLEKQSWEEADTLVQCLSTVRDKFVCPHQKIKKGMVDSCMIALVLSLASARGVWMSDSCTHSCRK